MQTYYEGTTIANYPNQDQAGYCRDLELWESTERGRRFDNDVDHYYYATLFTTEDRSHATWRPGNEHYTHEMPNGGATMSYWNIYGPHNSWTTAPVQGWGYDGLNGLPVLSNVPKHKDHDYTGSELTSVSCFDSIDPEPYIQQSLTAMLPGIAASLSIFNSIYELKDFKRLPALARRAAGFLRHMPRNLTDRKVLLRHKVKPTLRELTRLGSEAYLTNEFAIAPLLRELVALKSSLSSVQQEVARLLKNENKLQHRRFKADMSEITTVGFQEDICEDPASLGGSTYSTPTLMFWMRRTLYGQALFRASVSYTYGLSDYQRLNADMLGLLDSLGIGVGFTPQIIWNALPWSFVVDWFVGVNRLLKANVHRNLEPSVRIQRYCWSMKVDREIQFYNDVGPNLNPHSEGYRLAFTKTERAYKRRAHNPSYETVIKTSGLNGKEFSYIAALIGARI